MSQVVLRVYLLFLLLPIDLLSVEPVSSSENLIAVPSLSNNPIPNLLDASPNKSETPGPIKFTDPSLDSLDVLCHRSMQSKSSIFQVQAANFLL